jgi:hypothetical protein
MWIQTLLKELNIPSPMAARLWCDNIGAKYLSANPVFHDRSKHIEVDYHFVREGVFHILLTIDFISLNDELKISGSDTMLNYDVPISSPKSLS